ncbi:piggyBac transposable element-derived protein 3-like [Acyrthosiphon pisum]|uniref:PiggyBac transposable element-derived protein domain-containing protein n=1 Tax=Acyrthosiphon pisum TaxID=7029 RepID=A0A8R2D0S7_ACYPI|nr:piggyBac transposable element-derived protein 3-like [Acyrthosiphon pisum]|eukprot:XP_016655726.1 PREDICTED: piggyBac transposable element-derived protein 3-like [Acyrthosiphon pisum]
MDVPDDPESEDEYDVDDGDTDEQAQQEVIEFSNFFLQSACETGKNVKEPLIIDNSDVIIFDFPEFDFSHQTEDVSLKTTNTPSSSRTLRPRVSNSTNFSNKSISDHVIPDNTRTPEHIDNNTTIELAVNNTPDPVEVNRQWRKKNEITAALPDYGKSLGYNQVMFGDCKTATDIFLKLINPITENILDQSNLYATQKNKNLNLRENELLSFFGINFCMGYHKLPSYKHYWKGAKDLNVPAISEVMTRDRFVEILSNIHVNNNENISQNKKDKLFKLRPMIDSLNQIFLESSSGTRELSVDESMIKFKGRSTIKQYNPMKPIKRGYKLWCIADQNGYIMKFTVYQGKNETLEKEFENTNLGERIVLQLTKPFWNESRIVFFDNYFTTFSLLEKLRTQQTLACGTIRQNRKGMPQNFKKDSEIPRGEFDYRFSTSGIGIFKWKDNKVVHIASNYHGNEITSVDRTMKDGSRLSISCPNPIKDYNKYMGGVDHADRLRALYNVDRKSKKWWLRIFWGLLDITFVNAYVIYCQMFEKTDVFDFRRSVALGLMTARNTPSRKSISLKRSAPQTPSNRRKKTLSNSKDVRLGNRGIHWPSFGIKRGRCELCSVRGVESRPLSSCNHCRVFLCCNERKNCFVEYHQVDIV